MDQKTFYYSGEWGNNKNYLFGFKYDRQATNAGMWNKNKLTNNLNTKNVILLVYETNL